MRRMRFFVVLVVILGFMAGCNNEDSARFDFDWNARIVEDQLRAEGFYTSQFKFLMKAMNDSAVLLNTSDWFDSAFISRQGNQITFTYDSSRVCPDGLIRSGRVFITSQGQVTEPGFSATMTYGADYLRSGKRIEGTLLLQHVVDSVDLSSLLNFSVTDGRIHLESEFEYLIRYNSSFTISWVAGAGTPAAVGDDRFIVKGSSSGNGREHDSFRTVILDSLWLQPGCNYLRGGNSQVVMPALEVSNARVSYMSKDTCSAKTKVVFSGISSKGDPVVSKQYTILIGL